MKRFGFNKQGLILLILLFVGTVALAQNGRLERVRALKIAYVTDRIKLSPADAERFWPVYNRYEEDLKEIRRGFIRNYRDRNRTDSEEEARRYIDDNLDYQEALIDLKRKYKKEFLKVISAQQLADLYAAEREFRQMLIQRLRDRKVRR